MTYEQFKSDIYKHLETDKPEQWRDGQFVFNYIDSEFMVARDVHYIDHIDCYYDDSKIEAFLKASYNRIKKWQR